jgi:DNA helicase HerA-like ATPase
VPSEIVDVIVSLLFRTVFDFALWAPRPMESPLLIVCEEAHRYVPQKDDASFQDAREAIGRIAKEGRKYGVGLGLVSQRPAELDETILSQCNTVIGLRMSNERDQAFMRKALPDTTSHFVDVLPALKTGEAIVVGEGISVPARLTFERIPDERQPRSMSVDFSARWTSDNLTESYVEGIVTRWREGRRD